MFAVNEGLDTVAVKPVAQVYDFVTPLPVRAGVGDFFGNIADVRNALNNTLQGKLGDAATDLGRLLINSTVGIFGLFDVASELGLEKHDEDFGQTLAVWGWDDSSFLFWPLVGPSTVRDTGGLSRRYLYRSDLGDDQQVGRRPQQPGGVALRRCARRPAADRQGGRGSGARQVCLCARCLPAAPAQPDF